MSDPVSSPPVHLVMYGRTACHLCEDMWQAIEDLKNEFSFSLEFRDIDANPDWFERFSLKIPVLMSGSEEICHYHLDLASLRSHFSQQGDRL